MRGYGHYPVNDILFKKCRISERNSINSDSPLRIVGSMLSDTTKNGRTPKYVGLPDTAPVAAKLSSNASTPTINGLSLGHLAEYFVFSIEQHPFLIWSHIYLYADPLQKLKRKCPARFARIPPNFTVLPSS